MEEAAQVAPCSSQLDSADTTQALLKTFAWVEPPEENTYSLITTGPPQDSQDQPHDCKVHENYWSAVKIIPGMMHLNCCSFCL